MYIYKYIYMYIYTCIYIYIRTCMYNTYVYIYIHAHTYIYIYPSDPMNYVSMFKGRARPFSLWVLVPEWYKNFSLIILIRWQSTTQLCLEIQPTPHNLVRRIRSWSICFSGKEF